MKAKRLMIALFASAAVLSMSVNAMAAGSITNAVDTNKVTATVTEKNKVGDKEEITTKEVGVKLEKVEADTFQDKEIQREADIINDADADTTLEDAFKLIYEADKMPQVDLYDAAGLKEEKLDLSKFKFLSQVMNLTFEIEPTEEKPVEVTFTVNSITDKIEPFILHRCDEHGWEVLETEEVKDEASAEADDSEENVEAESSETESAESSKEIKATFHSAGGPVVIIYREIPEEQAEVATDVVAP